MDGYLQDRLNAAFPAITDAEVLRAVQQGIIMADGVVENEAFLRGPIGRDVRGYLRRAGILSRLNAACMAGDLPFDSVISQMPRGPFHWLEMRSEGIAAHVCRTESAGAFPEDTPTRQDERLPNPQGDLFEGNVVSLRDAAAKANKLFAWLSFGAPEGAKLGHLCWAMPSHDGKSWLAHTNILYRLAAANIDVEPEAPAERAQIKFKEEIAESLKATDDVAYEGRED